MSDLFEGWKGFNVQEERQKGKELGIVEGREQGEKIGKEIGKELTLVQQICKKLIKGKSASVIADEIEEEEELVKEISVIAEKYLPNYDAEKIYEEWKQQNDLKVQ